MMHLPKVVYYVAVLPGGKPLGYRQRGGKVFTNEQAAINHKDTLIAQGVRAVVYKTNGDWEHAHS